MGAGLDGGVRGGSLEEGSLSRSLWAQTVGLALTGAMF